MSDHLIQPTYHHVGTGRTRSDHWCRKCAGWYGVPHDGFVHDASRRHTEWCCCGSCLTDERRRSEGVVMVHANYLDTWDLFLPDDRWKLHAHTR